MSAHTQGLSRLAYVLLIVPCAVILYTPYVIMAGQKMIGFLDVPDTVKTDYAVTWLYATYLAVLPAMAIAAGRLRAVGLSTWLVVPMGLAVAIRYCVVFLIDAGPADWHMPLGSFEVMQAFQWYGKALLLALAVWPGRRAPLAVHA